jgi:N-acetylmuramoyl-L-alanine amidase
MKIRQNLVSTSKWNIKCPYPMNPTRIVIHNTANDASANNEIAYMISNNEYTSFHFAVDDIEVVQGLLLDRNGWHAGDGNGKGNREGIGIEICYSKSGGDRFIKAEQNCAELVAQLLKETRLGLR